MGTKWAGPLAHYSDIPKVTKPAEDVRECLSPTHSTILLSLHAPKVFCKESSIVFLSDQKESD